jgi:hypothetical protein
MYRIVLDEAIEASRRSIEPFIAMAEPSDMSYYNGATEGLKVAEQCESIDDLQRAFNRVQTQLRQQEGTEQEAYLAGALVQLGFVLKRLKDMQPVMAIVQKMHGNA